MFKVLTIIGARPQIIKAACVSNQISKINGPLEETILHTGQHFDKEMSGFFLDSFDNKSRLIQLDINRLPANLMVAKMLSEIDKVIDDIKPDLVLVYGDTNSTLSGALAASKRKIKIAHVEGGLRNFDLSIPEDVNRIITDRISDLIFYSTDAAYKNLMLEGFEDFPCKLVKTDDLLSDAVLSNIEVSRRKSEILSTVLAKSQLDSSFTLVTIHRDKSLNPENIKKVFDGINLISEDRLVLFPVHPNTKKILNSDEIHLSDRIIQLPPVSYFDMLKLLDACNDVVTDSGGLQREAYLLEKKSLLILGYTPWQELVENKCAITVGLETDEIIKGYNSLSQLESDFSGNLYGSGKAAEKIVDELTSFLSET